MPSRGGCPGVIAGALMAVCLYLIARILFRRRLVAGLVAVFVLLDGMLFVQSRIGMNDVYVGLFIIAAYTLFAAVWTGWWRSRAPLDRDADHRRAAGSRACLEVGRRVRDRCARPAAPRAQRARAGRGDPRIDRDHERARLHRDRRARGPGHRQRDLPADHGRPDPHGGRRGGPPPRRLDRRRTMVRPARPGRRRRGRLLRRAAPGASTRSTPWARSRSRRSCVALLASGSLVVATPSPSAGGWATDRWPPPRPGRPDAPSCRRPIRRPRTGCGPAGWPGCRSCSPRSVSWPSPSWSTSSRTSRGR